MTRTSSAGNLLNARSSHPPTSMPHSTHAVGALGHGYGSSSALLGQGTATSLRSNLGMAAGQAVAALPRNAEELLHPLTHPPGAPGQVQLPDWASGYVSLLCESCSTPGSIQRHLIRLLAKGALGASKTAQFVSDPLNPVRSALADKGSDLILRKACPAVNAVKQALKGGSSTSSSPQPSKSHHGYSHHQSPQQQGSFLGPAYDSEGSLLEASWSTRRVGAALPTSSSLQPTAGSPTNALVAGDTAAGVSAFAAGE